jgi:hypothetical protein
MVIDATKRCLLSLVVPALLAGPGAALNASAGESEVGTYGAPSLSIPVGARLISTSDAVVGMDPDASVLFSNPAFLATVPSSGLFLTTSNWLDDMRLSAASFALPFGQGYTFSLGSIFLYSGDLQGFDDALNVVSNESYYDLGATAAIAKRFGFGLSLGFGTTYLRQRLYPQDGNGYAFDAGASYETGPYMVHAAVRNFGGKVSFSDVDYTVDSQKLIGAARIFDAGVGRVYAGGQVVFSSAGPTRLELAADFRPHQLFSLKAALKDVSGTQDDHMGLDAGFGIHYGKIAIDYAYTPREYFSSTHTFSIVFEPGAGGRSRTYREEQARQEEAPARQEKRQTAKTQPKAQGPAHTAPVVDPASDPRTKPAKPAQPVTPPAAAQEPVMVYLVVAGIHGWESSARAEARSYEVLDIPATVERIGQKYRVVIGRYEKRKDAISVINKFKKSGQRFTLVEEPAR